MVSSLSLSLSLSLFLSLTALLPYVPVVLSHKTGVFFLKTLTDLYNNKLPCHETIPAVLPYSTHYSLT